MTTLVQRWQQSLMDNYGTPSLALVSGAGSVVYDEDGKSYVDMFSGIAVNALGHGHPAVIEAVTKQVSRLGHISNFFVAEPTVALAELLLALTGRPGRVYFGNSGTEAVEAAFKMSRLTGKTRIVAAEQAFHGRTMGALALTGQPSKRDAFHPLPANVVHVPYGDTKALAEAVDGDTAMVILEPIMGEAGVMPAPTGYLAAARELTEKHGALLALDEVQTGVGRTGHWFAHQAEGVSPDIVTLAKALGGGLPIGATIAFSDGAFAKHSDNGAAGLLKPGLHGSTFGGNPIACAAALAVLRTIASDGLLDHVKRIGERLCRGIVGHPLVTDVRGAGLLLGVVLTEPIAAEVAKALRDDGFLVNPCQPGVVRLAPPLILTTAQADSFIAAMNQALDAHK
jgi:acetylornithine/N-succinyldiaminopimelate aminotransferase